MESSVPASISLKSVNNWFLSDFICSSLNEQGFSQTYIMQKPRDFGDFVGKSPREAYLA